MTRYVEIVNPTYLTAPSSCVYSSSVSGRIVVYPLSSWIQVFRRKVPPTKKRQKYTTAKNYHCLRLLDGSGASSYRQKEVFSGFSYARWCHQGRLGDTVLRALYQGDRGETAGQIESIL